MIKYSRLIPEDHPNNPNVECEILLAFIFHYTGNDNLWATDTANAAYFRREYKVRVIDGKQKVFEADGETPFRYGSANKIIDRDSVTVCIPPGFGSYNCGDKPLPRDNGSNGQTPIARDLFGYKQNYRTMSYEMCNNYDWDKVVENTITEAVDDMIDLGISPDDIALLRHFDVTGKPCPKPFVDDEATWIDFKKRIRQEYNERTGSAVKEEIIMFKIGDSGEEVKEFIEGLTALGYKANESEIGIQEEAAIMHFQKKNGLEVDGVAGPQTLAKIEELLPPKEPVEEPAEEPVEEPVEEPAEEPVEEPVEEPAEEPAEEPVEYLLEGRVLASLNFRSGPSTDTEILATLNKGDIVKVKKIQGSWANCDFGDLSGWVFYSYVCPVSDVSHPNFRRFRMYGSDVNVFEVTPEMFLDLEAGIQDKKETLRELELTSELNFLGEEVARMNAQFFDYTTDGLGSMVDEGKLIQGPDPSFLDVAMGINGSMMIKRLDQEGLEKLLPYVHWVAGSSWQLMQYGLLDIKNDVFSHAKERHPRSILAWFAPYHFAFVVVDGRNTSSQVDPEARNEGVTAEQSAKILKGLKSVVNGKSVVHAANFDGGGSSTLVARDIDGVMRVKNSLPSNIERAIGTGFVAYYKKK